MSELSETLKRLDESLTPGPWEANPGYPREGGGGLSRYVESETRTVCQTAKGTDDVEGIATLRNLLPTLIAAEAERERLREALAFYADENRYDYDVTCCPEDNNPGIKVYGQGILDDRGDAARAALQPNAEGQ